MWSKLPLSDSADDVRTLILQRKAGRAALSSIPEQRTKEQSQMDGPYPYPARMHMLNDRQLIGLKKMRVDAHESDLCYQHSPTSQTASSLTAMNALNPA